MGMGTQKMNRFTYTNLSYAYGEYLKETYGENTCIVIGYDNRMNSKTFARLCANVISSFKIKVLLFKHLIPTPIVSYAIRELKAVGGIIITASHNPKEYNGFKAYHNDGGQILPDVVKKITNHLKPSDSILNITYSPNKKYVKHIGKNIIKKYMLDARSALVNKNVINNKNKFQIVFTGHHGTASKLLPKFLRSLNFVISPVKKQCFYNSSFINSPLPNPESENSFDLAIKQANNINSKIIIGVDPDADRMAIMIKHNEKWRLMSGNEMGIIYTYYVLHNKKFNKQPYLISSFVSTNLIDRIAKEFSAQVYRTGTGFK
jgi:phosphomannomutase